MEKAKEKLAEAPDQKIAEQVDKSMRDPTHAKPKGTPTHERYDTETACGGKLPDNNR
jgi:hypothetical protein